MLAGSDQKRKEGRMTSPAISPRNLWNHAKAVSRIRSSALGRKEQSAWRSHWTPESTRRRFTRKRKNFCKFWDRQSRCQRRKEDLLSRTDTRTSLRARVKNKIMMRFAENTRSVYVLAASWLKRKRKDLNSWQKASNLQSQVVDASQVCVRATLGQWASARIRVG